MRYLVVVNNEEALDVGGEYGFDEAKYEIEELLRSGYYKVESIKEIVNE